MTSLTSRPTQGKGDSRIVHQGDARFAENRTRLVELLGTPISTVFLATNKNFATITFSNDAMARVTLAGMVDTTNIKRFLGTSMEDLHEHFRALLLSGAASRMQASSETGYDIDIVINDVEYRVRFSVIAIF